MTVVLREMNLLKKLMHILFFVMILLQGLYGQTITSGDKINGYRGIWFELNQKLTYGDKYSGGLGTYTAKHHPLAIYSEEANKTFFVYGGTTEPGKRELLAMLSYYDHETDQVPRPVVIHAKKNVNDPHDNPSISIDDHGHLWLFVSGRSTKRSGYIYRSKHPFDINHLELVREGTFAYPQPVFIKDKGFLFLFTKYTKGRELYWNVSPDGFAWGPDHKLVAEGHYQMTNHRNHRVITAFNAHPNGVDTRTNLFYLQTDDMGHTWRTANGTLVETPVTGLTNNALIRDYQSRKRLVYLKDISFDRNGHPILLYITSASHQPGPEGEPRIWTVAHWSGVQWLFHEITRSTHNYDMGSLYIEDAHTWRLIAPTEAGPQFWGTGGEIAFWQSNDSGQTWIKEKDVTRHSEYNHCYVRRPVHAHPDFYAFWADGHADEFSVSRLYFTNRSGDKVYRLPYHMTSDFATPILINTSSGKKR